MDNQNDDGHMVEHENKTTERFVWRRKLRLRGEVSRFLCR